MAVVPVCYKMYYKDQMCTVNLRKYVDVSRRIIHDRISVNGSKRDKLCTIWNALESGSNEKQLRSLDTYFGKLQHGSKQPSSNSLNNNRGELLDKTTQSKAEKGLGSLDNYLGKLKNKGESLNSNQSKARNRLGSLTDYLGKVNEDAKSKNYASRTSSDENTEAARYLPESDSENRVQKLKNYITVQKKDGPESSYDETSNLYLISTIVSINIAVFLFEIASPVRNPDSELFSLPLLYGAKINDLILLGEWWRLVTPMFLHTGILHVALGCWALLNFGPRVCRAYGSFTFFLIYILGGISGNLISFLHTPELTVGGTGPVFAIIGAWLIYEIQNRDASGKDDSESIFQKAIIATAFSCILSNFGPIDDWTHLGAAFSGMAYGFLTLPSLQLDDASTKAGQEEGITILAQRYADPCKSFLFFSLFILVLTSLLFIIEPPLDTLATYRY
uniref:Rhomboid protein Lonja_RBL9 n=1 Tax=Lonicera japonica TaxID=105884 RepID=A0A0A7E6I6_LONJA|nr:rhomboid protein Lonja_RBL9 [Lonicera japonica]